MSSFLPYHETARILVLATFGGKSHQKVMETITQALLDRGHNITIITTDLKDNPPENCRQIEVETHPEFQNSDYEHMPKLIM